MANKMKNTSNLLLVLGISLSLFSCEANYDHNEANAEKQDAASISGNTNEGAAAMGTDLKSNERKIIKTADFKARVDNVYDATHRLEQSVNAANGLVTESVMENQTTATRTLAYKTDSLKQVQSYTTTAHITIRISVNLVDTFMSAMASQAKFIDSRNLKLDDVTLQYLSNNLKNIAATESVNSNQPNALSKKTQEAISANDYSQRNTETSISRKIENLGIRDQSSFATIRIDLYQPERLDAVIIPDVNHLMKPSFGDQLHNGLQNGWEVLKLIIIGISNIWALLLLAIVTVLFVYKRKKIFPAIKPVLKKS